MGVRLENISFLINVAMSGLIGMVLSALLPIQLDWLSATTSKMPPHVLKWKILLGLKFPVKMDSTSRRENVVQMTNFGTEPPAPPLPLKQSTTIVNK